jgi:hypothetical protein
MPGTSNLDAILGRAVRDAEFRKRLLSDSKAIAMEYKLSKEEQATLDHLNQKEADKFFSQIAGGRAVMYCTNKTCGETG